MIDILNMSMDVIADIQPRREQQKPINPDDHYWVEAHGVSLIVTADKKEAISIYRDSRDTDKKVMRCYKGKLYQILPRG